MLGQIKVVECVLFGGLGNQLFMYSEAYSLARSHGAALVLDVKGLPSRGQQNGSSILALDLPRDVTKPSWGVLNYVYKFFLFRKMRGIEDPITRTLFSSSRQKLISVGYFQTISAAEVLSGMTLSLSAPESTEYREIGAWIEREPHLAIHHRLGDSTSLTKNRGVVGTAFFLEALERVENTMGVRPKVLVFTDDVTQSQKLFGSLLSQYNQKYASDTMAAAEVLLLMSRCKNLAVSNSTLGWWAAVLGNEKLTFSPRGWFREANSDLNLESWTTLDPRWQD